MGSAQVGVGSVGVRPRGVCPSGACPDGGRLRLGSARVAVGPGRIRPGGVPPHRRAFALWERLRGAASRSGGEAPAALPAVPTGRGDCTWFRGAARTCGARVVPPGRRVSETCCSCVRGGQGGCGLLAVKNEDLLENH